METNPEPKTYLTEEDKRFIVDNYNKMSALQIALRRGLATEGTRCKLISDFITDSKLQPNTEAKESTTSIKTIEIPKDIDKAVDEIVGDELTIIVPNDDEKPYADLSIEAFIAVLRGLNIFVREPPSEKEKKDIAFLINQMDSKRYLFTFRSYKRKDCKELFREEFIRAMYGKGEMPQEEVNDFIDLCNEVVFEYDTKCKIRELEKQKDDLSSNEKDPRQRGIREAALIAIITNLHEVHAKSTERATAIKKSLGASREQRLKDSRPAGLTVIALIEAFQNGEKREALLKLQQKKDGDLRTAVLMLDELDETKALILGISPDELIQGGL